MPDITVHVINNDGFWDCTRTGDIENVMYSVDIEEKDFTMTPPPDMKQPWRWVNNEWIADETAN